MSVVILMKPYPAQLFKLFVLYLDPLHLLANPGDWGAYPAVLLDNTKIKGVI